MQHRHRRVQAPLLAARQIPCQPIHQWLQLKDRGKFIHAMGLLRSAQPGDTGEQFKVCPYGDRRVDASLLTGQPNQCPGGTSAAGDVLPADRDPT